MFVTWINVCLVTAVTANGRLHSQSFWLDDQGGVLSSSYFSHKVTRTSCARSNILSSSYSACDLLLHIIYVYIPSYLIHTAYVILTLSQLSHPLCHRPLFLFYMRITLENNDSQTGYYIIIVHCLVDQICTLYRFLFTLLLYFILFYLFYFFILARTCKRIIFCIYLSFFFFFFGWI